MTERLRAVLDTNVFVSAFLSKNPSSPTREILSRWQADEFTLLLCDALVEEIAEKLIQKGISEAKATEFLALLERLAEWVEVPPGAVAPVLVRDPDDDVILACAEIGRANFVVTYDPDFDPLHGEWKTIKVTKALPFPAMLCAATRSSG